MSWTKKSKLPSYRLISCACSLFYDISDYILFQWKSVYNVSNVLVLMSRDGFVFLFLMLHQTWIVFLKLLLFVRPNISLKSHSLVLHFLGMSFAPWLLILVETDNGGGHDGAELLNNIWNVFFGIYMATCYCDALMEQVTVYW
jgi:hypothetical protein